MLSVLTEVVLGIVTVLILLLWVVLYKISHPNDYPPDGKFPH
jgi:hypothetical protein